jgi:hypothetical protein
MKRTVLTLLGTAALVGLAVQPATATVHEITGMFCSERGNPFPPGLSDPTRDNFAQPLVKTGFIESVTPYVGTAGPGVLISFDFDHPASKIVGTGQIFFVGDGTYITGFTLDPDAGFTNCQLLRG